MALAINAHRRPRNKARLVKIARAHPRRVLTLRHQKPPPLLDMGIKTMVAMMRTRTRNAVRSDATQASVKLQQMASRANHHPGRSPRKVMTSTKVLLHPALIKVAPRHLLPLAHLALTRMTHQATWTTRSNRGRSSATSNSTERTVVLIRSAPRINTSNRTTSSCPRARKASWLCALLPSRRLCLPASVSAYHLGQQTRTSVSWADHYPRPADVRAIRSHTRHDSRQHRDRRRHHRSRVPETQSSVRRRISKLLIIIDESCLSNDDLRSTRAHGGPISVVLPAARKSRAVARTTTICSRLSKRCVTTRSSTSAQARQRMVSVRRMQ